MSGTTATPMGLMSMGATFELRKATSKNEADNCGSVYEAGWILCGFFAGSSSSWI